MKVQIGLLSKPEGAFMIVDVDGVTAEYEIPSDSVLDLAVALVLASTRTRKEPAEALTEFLDRFTAKVHTLARPGDKRS